jgi:anti-sigma regulatory factor (Ser/Thr protein kinase)
LFYSKVEHQLFFSSIAELSQVAEVRRLTTQLAARIGFNEPVAGKVALVVTEIVTNLVKYAKAGRLLVRALRQDNNTGLEILALDQGPGMANVNECLQDGYSTSGSSGTGFGAIMRLSTFFDLYSLPGRGTALVAQLWAQEVKRKTTPSASSPLQVGVVCLAHPNEEVSGDSWGVEQQPGCCLIMVADGLGHGPDAAKASQAAIDVLARHPVRTPKALVEAAHTALHGTRGAALAVVELNLAQQSLKFAGIGNIAGMSFAGQQRHHFASHNGIVGHQLSRVQEFVYPWADEIFLLLHSDGLASRWSLDTYPGLMARHPSLIAGVLYRDFQRGYDDVTVLVVKK